MADYTLSIDPIESGFRASLYDPTDFDGPSVGTATGVTRDEAVAALITTITFDNEEN
jgi:hypothetical protein